MTPVIDTIFMDLGNTLRFVEKDAAHIAAANQKIIDLLGIDEDPALFYSKLKNRYKEYRNWALENHAEAPEAELWTRWLTPDLPAEEVAPISTELTYYFRQSNGRRVVVDGGKEVIAELKERGYKLGIISNLISTSEIPEWLEEDGLAHYFSSVVLSSVFGRRKPDPEIYYEAARRAESRPETCAYVGDNLNRDVTGSRVAGFGMTVIFNSPEAIASAEITEENRPDVTIHNFRELLNIFTGVRPDHAPNSREA